MLAYLMYDIQDNGKREKVANVCKFYGLYRIQKSVFFGNISNDVLENLKIKSKKYLDKEDSCIIVKLCSSCKDKIEYLGKKLENDDLILGLRKVEFV